MNRELKVQGLGNFLSGLIGGMPITSVIVRSSANVQAGAKTQVSTIFHGILLVVCAFTIPHFLSMIPLAALASILVVIGYRLSPFSAYKAMCKKNFVGQTLPFFATILAIFCSNLLQGLMIGLAFGIISTIIADFRDAIILTEHNGKYLVRLTRDVSFLNKIRLRHILRNIPEKAYVLIDGTKPYFIDQDIVDAIYDFEKQAPVKNIQVEIKKSTSSANPHFLIR